MCVCFLFLYCYIKSWFFIYLIDKLYGGVELKNRGIAVFSIALILITVISATVISDNGFLNVSAGAPFEKTVILDAGHGGFDGGAVAIDGTVEKDINLNISLTLESLLKQNGFCVIMTRNRDVSTEDTESSQIASKKKSDLRNRLNLMKDYPEAVFVSIHLNKFTTSSASGSQVFYSDDQRSKLLGEYIQRSIVSLIQHDNMRVNKKATSSTYLLYNATVPAVLVECGFLSNREELAKLKQKDYQNKIAFSIYCGIMEYFKENGNGSKV